MYSYFMSYFYEGDQKEDLVIERQKRLIYLLNEQVKKSKLKLDPVVKEELKINFIKPVPSSKIIKNKKIKKQSLSEFLSQKVK